MFTIITGAQFGDEGKGKIIDLLARDYDIVVRFQGGDNAGHTVVVDGKTYKLHLIPSGVLFPARLLIGPGCVLNPKVLMMEIDMLRENNIRIDPVKLGIDAKTSVVMSYHIEMDSLRERARKEKIGTTKRGIGYAYIDKVARDEVQMADLLDRERFLARIREIAPQKESDIKELGGDPNIVRDSKILEEYLELGRRLRPYLTDVSLEVNQAFEMGKRVLAEGAQGTHLDIIHGTQKFVTSSSTIAGSACANLGVGPTKVSQVIGLIKAYITRVGEGPLPTEQRGEVGDHLLKMGREYGTTTGRPRRCGWFDLPLAKKAVSLNGYTSLALMKLDVLSGLDPVKICTSYRLDGLELSYPPELASDLSKCEPVYLELEGWNRDITGISEFSDLPDGARAYVEKLEKLLGVKIEYVSVGPARGQTFKR